MFSCMEEMSLPDFANGFAEEQDLGKAECLSHFQEGIPVGGSGFMGQVP